MTLAPRMAIKLLRRLASSDKCSEVEGDLLEGYELWLKRGRLYASLRFWREVLLIPLWRVVGAWRERSDRVGLNGVVSVGRGFSGNHSSRGSFATQKLAQDVRYGFRTMAKDPGFAIVAVLILGLGIGANSTMFTLVNSLFLQAPPLLNEPNELVGLTIFDEDEQIDYFSYPDYVFYRDNNDVFSGVMAYDDGETTLAVGMDDEVVQAEAWTVSFNFFDVLGVAPVLGRSFLREEDVAPGVRPVVMISQGFWSRYYGADPAVVNSSITLNGQPFTIVGVVPREFRGPNAVKTAPDLYLPLNMTGAISPGGEEGLEAINGQIWLWLRVIGRLRPEANLETARAHMGVLQSRWESGFASWIEATFDEDDGPFRVGLGEHVHLTHRQAEQLRQYLTPLFLAVGAVLLIACANVAILLLARASARQREMGIRAALGASRGRVIGQLLTESLLLGGIGSIFGIVVAYWGAGLAAGLIPMSLAGDFKPDLPVFGFTIALAGGAALFFGLVPALQLSRSDIAIFLHRLGHSKSRANIRNALVVAQLTLSIVLATGAGLFVRSLLYAQRVDLGFEQDWKLLLNVIPGNHGYAEDESKEFLRVMLDRIQMLPGVRSASITDRIPFRGMWTSGFEAPGTEYVDENRYASGFNRVGPGYFETIGIPIVAGREFASNDDELGPNVVVVNEYVAEEVWPGEYAVGKTIIRNETEWTVIGVAKNAVYYDIGEEPRAQTYHAFLQDYRPQTTFAVATAGDPKTMLPQVQQVIRDYDPNIAIFNIRTLEEVVARELGQFSVMAILVALFGLLALFLSAVGLYGVQSFLVARRTREIGIRMAMGALERQVASAVLGRGIALAAVGVVLGVIAAYASAQFIQSLLFGVEARDPLTFVTVPMLLLLVAAGASLFPALRASRVEPVEALREE